MLERKKEYNYILLIVVAYLFGVGLRLLWLYQHGSEPEFLWNGEYIINTNDGYFFGSGVQKALFGLHEYNPLVPGVFDRGLVLVSTVLVKILPLKLDTVMFYLPIFIAPLVVVPIVLIGKLYNSLAWGFFAALIASIAWSYYNRTMIGYYDTDMFSISVLMFIFYFLLKSIKRDSFNALFVATVIMVLYAFLYKPGKNVLFGLGITYIAYRLAVAFLKKGDFTLVYRDAIMLFVALIPLRFIDAPLNYLTTLLLLSLLYVVFNNRELPKRVLMVASIALFLSLLYFGGAFEAVVAKINVYTATGTRSAGLHFLNIMQTVSEASKIPFFDPSGRINVAARIIGSALGFLLFIGGYIYLVYQKREFIIALPLIAIGLFAHWGGLRFTIYAVPFAALSVVYLFMKVSQLIENKKVGFAFAVLATLGILIPNITHIYNYDRFIRPVFLKSEIKDLDKLKQIASPKDYTLSWWDYGYPIWYYTNTNTLIDGGKHHDDNFIIASLLLSNSSQFASNLAKLSVESYVKAFHSYKNYIQSGEDLSSIDPEYRFTDKKGSVYHSGHPYNPIIDTLMRNEQSNQVDPNEFLAKLSSNQVTLPKKRRDIYLYMPMKSLSIFPVIAEFGNLDLTSGEKKRNITFVVQYAKAQKGYIKIGNRGAGFNMQNGVLQFGSAQQKVKDFIIATNKADGKIALASKLFNPTSGLSIIYLASYGKVVILDNETLNSLYVKMFLLGIYDKEYFDLVVSSPYSRVYRFK